VEAWDAFVGARLRHRAELVHCLDPSESDLGCEAAEAAEHRYTRSPDWRLNDVIVERRDGGVVDLPNCGG